MSTKLSAKTPITGVATAVGDLFLIVDVSTGASHYITRAELHAAIVSGEFSSQGVAETGADNTKLMTPLRTAQAIAAQTSSALTFLATRNLVSVATAVFTEFDSALYDSYVFTFANVIPVTDSRQLWMRTSSDGGSTYDSAASDYCWVVDGAKGTTGTPNLSWAVDETDAQIDITKDTVGSAANEDGVSGTLELFAPHLTKRTGMTWQVSYMSATGGQVINHGGARRLSSADVDAVQFLFSAGSLESGTINMYGRSNA